MRTGSSIRRPSSFVEEAQVDVAAFFFAAARAGLAFLGFRFLDQLDAMLLQMLEELVEPLGIGGIVGQHFVDLNEGQESLPFTGIDQRLEAFVQLEVHAPLLTAPASRPAPVVGIECPGPPRG